MKKERSCRIESVNEARFLQIGTTYLPVLKMSSVLLINVQGGGDWGGWREGYICQKYLVAWFMNKFSTLI